MPVGADALPCPPAHRTGPGGRTGRPDSPPRRASPQAAGHLAQGLGPAGWSRRWQPRRTHVTEVLGDGDAGIDGGLTGGHRHVGGVGDRTVRFIRDSPCGGPPARGTPQHVGHLVAPFAAADADHDVHVRPLGSWCCITVFAEGRGWQQVPPLYWAGRNTMRWPESSRVLGDTCACRAALHGRATSAMVSASPPSVHQHRHRQHREGTGLDGLSMVPDRVGAPRSCGAHTGLLDGAQHVASGGLVAGPGHCW